MISMAKEPNNSNCECSPSLDELLNDMQNQSGKYKHLQIVHYRNINSLKLGLGQKYLVVNNVGFGVYQLNEVDYCDGIIKMFFTNSSTGEQAEISLDINDEHPQVLLICWKDIKQMVFNEYVRDVVDDELLEFDFE
jgi:hypothetical protein